MHRRSPTLNIPSTPTTPDFTPSSPRSGAPPTNNNNQNPSKFPPSTTLSQSAPAALPLRRLQPQIQTRPQPQTRSQSQPRSNSRPSSRSTSSSTSHSSSTSRSSSSSRSNSRSRSRSRQHPTFPAHVRHLRSGLHPLLSIESGEAHPSFPPTLLHYHLLTEPQLDALAAHYHQAAPSVYSLGYPAPVVGRWVGGGGGPVAKRRRFGRFIGLRGCESPVLEGRGEGSFGEAEREAEWVAMRAWVERRVRVGMEEELERERRREKGF